MDQPNRSTGKSDREEKVAHYGFCKITPDNVKDAVTIESECYQEPWNEKEFRKVLKKRDVTGWFIDVEMLDQLGKPLIVRAGFVIVQIQREFMLIRNLAVDVLCRREGFGAALIDFTKKIAEVSRCDVIDIPIQESNLGAQLFLKSQGFLWIETLPAVSNYDEDDYIMQFKLKGTKRAT